MLSTWTRFFTAAKGLFDLIQFKKHRNALSLVSRL